MSQYYVVDCVQDNVYGQTGAKDLAITNPDHAINNAAIGLMLKGAQCKRARRRPQAALMLYNCICAPSVL